MSQFSGIRSAILLAFIVAMAIGLFLQLGDRANASGQHSRTPQSAVFAPAVTATMTSSLVTTGCPGASTTDLTCNGLVNPGDTIRYTVTVTNNGIDPATGVNFTDAIDAATGTLNAGSVLVSPIAHNDAVPVTGNVKISGGNAGAPNVLTNDIRPAAGNNSNLAATGESKKSSVCTGLGAACVGNNVTINPNGTFDYNPPAGFEGADSFTYTVTDTTPGNGLSSTGTVNITVTGMIWFVNSAAAAGGDGRLSSPFNCLVGAGCYDPATDDPGDNIFLYSGAYTGSLTIQTNQRIIGQGASDTIATITGLTLAPGSDALPATGGAAPTWTSSGTTLTLGQGNTIRGIAFGNAGGTTNAKILGNNFGTLTVGKLGGADVSLDGTGKALDLTNGTFAATSAFSSVKTTSSGAHGMSIVTVGGTVAFGQTDVSGSTAQGIFVNNSAVNLNFGNTTIGATGGSTECLRLETNTGGTRTFGTLSTTNCTAQGITISGGGNVNVTGLTTVTNPGSTGILVNAVPAGSTVTFANVSDTQSGGAGVSLSNNVGTVTFADLDISPDSGQAGLTIATSSGATTTTTGSITVTGSQAISASSSSNLNLIFDDVTQSGGSVSAISLSSDSGSLTMKGGTLTGNATAPTYSVSAGTVNATYQGNITQANNAAMVNVTGGHTGTLTFDTGTLTATNGTGLQFDNADGTYDFNGTNTLNNTVGGATANAGVDITNGSNGSFTFSSNSSITGQTSTSETAFNASGAGVGNISYGGTIGTTTPATDNAGTSVSVTGHTGGTVGFTGNIRDSSDTGGGIGISGNANTTINFSGTAKTLNTGIGDGVSITNNTGTSSVNFTGGGLTVQTTNGTAFQDTVAGTVSVTGAGNTLTTATTNGSGTALNLDHVTVGTGVLFDSVTTTANGANGSANGILLNTLSGGSVTVSGGTLAGVTTRGVDINATANDISIGASISPTSAGRSVEVTSTTGNKTITFPGAISETGLGINLTTNTGTTMNFTGGITASTGANTAFNATGGGTVNVCDENPCSAAAGGLVNSLTTTSGTALNVQNTTIGVNGITLRSVNAGAGAGNGITLSGTGGGSFTVAGTGVANSGGVITGRTGADATNGTTGTGIYFNNISGPISLSRMDVEGCQNYGIRGINVSGGLTIDNSTVGVTATNGNNNFQAPGVQMDPESTTLGGESSVRFTNLTGTVNFTNDSFDRGYGRTVLIHNNTGTLNLAITNSTLRQMLTNATGDPTGGTTDALTIQGINNSVINATVTGSHFTAYRQFGMLSDAQGSASMSFEFANNDFSNENTGNVGASCALNFGGSGSSGNDVHVKYYVHNNTFRHGSGATVPTNGGAQIVSGGVSGGTAFDGRIINNTFGVSGLANSGAGGGADALRLFASGNHAATNGTTGSTHTRYLVQGNTIQRYGEVGIQLNSRQGNGIMDVTVLGNIIREPGTAAAGAFAGIWVNVGALAADTNTMNLAIGSAGTAADKNTLQDSDPNNFSDVFIDDTSCAGCASVLNMYQNGSDAAGATPEDKARDVLMDNNNPVLNFGAGFTTGTAPAHINFLPGLPSQPSIPAPPAELLGSVSADVEGVGIETPTLLGEMAFAYLETQGRSSEPAERNNETMEHGSESVGAKAEVVAASVEKGPSAVEMTPAQGETGYSPFDILASIGEKVSSQLTPTVYSQTMAEPEGSGGTVNAAIGTLDPGASVTIYYDVQLDAVGMLPANVFQVTNNATISGSNFSNVTTDGDGNAMNGQQDTVTKLIQPENISKAFSPKAVQPNAPSVLTFTIKNDNPAGAGANATGVTFTDVFPANLVVANPANASTTCTSGVLRDQTDAHNLQSGDTGLLLKGASVNTVSQCTVMVSVTSAAGGNYDNTTQVISSVEGAFGLASNTDRLRVFTQTAATVSIAGRVVTQDGRGVTNARVVLTDPMGTSRTVITRRGGAFGFDDVQIGYTYTLAVASQRFTFFPRVIAVTDQVQDMIIVASP